VKVLLANPRGFCAGVKRAIAIVEESLKKYGAPVYVLHEIVHNTHVVNTLAEKGALFVETLEEIPPGSVTIFSAHGVSKAVEEKAAELALNTIDATCPLVQKVHRRVARLSEEGFDVLIIGHKNHPEIEGTCGRATGRVHVISRSEDVHQLPIDNTSRVGYVTQTTLSMDDAAEIITLFKKRFPDINAPAHTDICYATQNRQLAVRSLAPQVDLFLVVGSKNSSNSNRLREVAEKNGTTAYLIDSVKDIDPVWLSGAEVIGVTAGASAPESLVEEVVVWLRQRCDISMEEIDGITEHTLFTFPDLVEIAK
jgi:4-hydroxy-3-methylbut-2-enyl diphosphate reductase